MSEQRFDTVSGAMRVVFERGSRSKLSALLPKASRVLLVATPSRRPSLDQALGGQRWQLSVPFGEVPQHVPRETLEAAAAVVEREGLDAAIAFGGGSAIGLVKALAARHDLRKVYVPTTFSGSEVTNIWAVTDVDGKSTFRDERVRADIVIYDADLVDSMPKSLLFPSLFNAMAHAVEALYAPGASPALLADAEQSLGTLGAAIDALSIDEGDVDAREQALFGAYLSGKTLDEATLGIHHKLAHVLGGSFGLPHGPTHTVLLPYSLAYNRDHIVPAMGRMRRALGGDPIQQIVRLQKRSGVQMSLKSLGMSETGVERAVAELANQPYPNPRPLEEQPLRELLGAAWAGEMAG